MAVKAPINPIPTSIPNTATPCPIGVVQVQVAVSNSRDGRDGPPQPLAEVVDVRTLGVALGNRDQTSRNKHQRSGSQNNEVKTVVSENGFRSPHHFGKHHANSQQAQRSGTEEGNDDDD